jgi:hypothetical protein
MKGELLDPGPACLRDVENDLLTERFARLDVKAMDQSLHGAGDKHFSIGAERHVQDILRHLDLMLQGVNSSSPAAEIRSDNAAPALVLFLIRH